MIISNCKQGGEEWENLRAGKLTGSEFGKVLGSSDHKRYSISAPAPPEGFGRATAQAAVYEQIAAAGDGGLLRSDIESASALSALSKRGIVEERIDSTGCTIKRAAAASHIDLLVARMRYTPAELGVFVGSDAMARGKELEDASAVEFEFETGISTREIGFAMHDELNLVGVSPDRLTDDGGVFETKSLLPQNHLAILRTRRLPSEFRAQVHGQIAVCGVEHCWFQAYCPGLPTVRLRVMRDGYTDNLLRCLHAFESMYVDQLIAYEL